jgi:elongation factor Tu
MERLLRFRQRAKSKPGTVFRDTLKDGSQGTVTPTKPAFVLPIEDIFYITGRGTVVTGVVKNGTCQVGQEVAILKNGVQVRRSVVTGIEKFRKLIDTAETRDNVGILLRSVAKEELEPGMVVAGLI